MKSLLPLLSTLIVFASCTTAYKSGQTPDDVYYSPTRPHKEYVQVEKEDDQYRRNDNGQYNRNDDFYSYDNDRYLRMKIRNRDQWSYLDDYYRDPYAYTYSRNNYYDSYCSCNPRGYWNSNYNPYGPRVIIVQPKTTVYNRPRTYNLRVFDNPPKDNSTNPKTQGTSGVNYKTSSGNDNNNSSQNSGSTLRNIFRGSNSSSNNNSASQSTTPSSSSSSSSSSSGSSSGGSKSGGNAPARKF